MSIKYHQYGLGYEYGKDLIIEERQKVNRQKYKPV